MITESFGLNVPTHIKFVLYRYDHIDGILISRIKNICKNYSKNNDPNHFTIKKSDFENAIISSKRLCGKYFGDKEKSKTSTVYFLGIVLSKLKNIEWLSFNISYDKEYTRITTLDNMKVINFDFNVDEGIIDLTKIFNLDEIQEFNKSMIKMGILSNDYLNRKSFIKTDSSSFFELLSILEHQEFEPAIRMLDLLDPKLENDNTILFVKTDYLIY